MPSGGDYLGNAEVAFTEDDLAGQIRELDRIGIDEGEVPNSRACQSQGRRHTESTDSDDQNLLFRQHVQPRPSLRRVCRRSIWRGSKNPRPRDKTRVSSTLALSTKAPKHREPRRT